MKRLLALASGLCLFASPALAAWAITHKDAKVSNSTGSLASSSMSVTAGHVILVSGGAFMPTGATVLNVTDGAGDTFTKYQCPQTASDVHVSLIAFTITAGLSAQTVTVANSSGTGTIFFSVEDVTGGAPSSIEDSAARACTGSTSATTSQTVTSGTPGTAGDLFVSSLIQQQGSAAGSFTEDGTWNATPGSGGGTTLKYEGATITNAGTSPLTRAPTTNSIQYSMNVLALKPLPVAGTAPCLTLPMGVGSC